MYPNRCPVGLNLLIVLLPVFAAYRLPPLSKAMPLGVTKPLLANMPRAVPVGLNFRMLLLKFATYKLPLLSNASPLGLPTWAKIPKSAPVGLNFLTSPLTKSEVTFDTFRLPLASKATPRGLSTPAGEYTQIGPCRTKLFD